jgi:hypothetical protein
MSAATLEAHQRISDEPSAPPHGCRHRDARSERELLVVHSMRPPTVAAVPGCLAPLDHSRAVAEAAGHVVLHGADLAATVGRAVGGAALELVDQARGLKAGARRYERDAALHRELAQVALLARRGWRSGGLWVVIGHGRAQARRARPSSPGPSGLAKRPAGQGLTAPSARRATAGGQDRAPPAPLAPGEKSYDQRAASSLSASASSAWHWLAPVPMFESAGVIERTEGGDTAGSDAASAFSRGVGAWSRARRGQGR